jgi:hypothetical protein
MLITFIPRADGPERMICEAELLFGADAGPLSGLKLVGFTLWRGPDGEVYVTLPSRAFGNGTERKYFDYLRSVEGSAEAVRSFKAWVLNAYRNQVDDHA